MERRALWRIGLAGAALLGAALITCAPDPPSIVGTWRNRDRQILAIGRTLNGFVYQIAECAPALAIKVKRDPYDAYAIQFEADQSVYFSPRQQPLFEDARLFCSSKDSVPMCQFCRIEGQQMTCETTEQKIIGRGATVTHDCTWQRVSSSTRTPEVTTYDTGPGCPPLFDAGGCRPSPLPDAGSGGGRDAGVPDATVADAT